MTDKIRVPFQNPDIPNTPHLPGVEIPLNVELKPFIWMFVGDRHSSKEQKAIELAKEKGVDFVVLVPRYEVKTTRARFPGINVRSASGPHGKRARLVVLLGAERINSSDAARCIAPGTEIIISASPPSTKRGEWLDKLRGQPGVSEVRP